MEGIMRLSNHIPIVAARMPWVFDEKWRNKIKPTFMREANPVKAIDGIIAIIQKNNPDMQKPSASGISTFIHLSKNKYCAVKMATRTMDIPNIMICHFAVTLFSSRPYNANLFNHFILSRAGSQDSKRQ